MAPVLSQVGCTFGSSRGLSDFELYRELATRHLSDAAFEYSKSVHLSTCQCFITTVCVYQSGFLYENADKIELVGSELPLRESITVAAVNVNEQHS